jgi:hypothetical protein
MVKRLVLRPGVDAPAVHIEPSSELTGPPLHLGSQDLVRLAGFARSNGFQVARFFIADAYLSPLEEAEQLELSADLVKILDDFDEEELEAALADEYDGLYVIGLELISYGSGLRLGVLRSGYVSTSAAEEREAERLMSDAWRELRLA